MKFVKLNKVLYVMPRLVHLRVDLFFPFSFIPRSFIEKESNQFSKWIFSFLENGHDVQTSCPQNNWSLVKYMCGRAARLTNPRVMASSPCIGHIFYMLPVNRMHNPIFHNKSKFRVSNKWAVLSS